MDISASTGSVCTELQNEINVIKYIQREYIFACHIYIYMNIYFPTCITYCPSNLEDAWRNRSTQHVWRVGPWTNDYLF